MTVLTTFEPSFTDAEVVTFTVTSIGPESYEGTLADGRSAVLPSTELPPQAKVAVGSKVMATVVYDDDRPICSTTTASLVAGLYAGVVPELRSGEVRIMNVARVPGIRSKVAVAATRDGVDPVAAMIGRDANRVVCVAKMLSGERIDVVPFSSDLTAFARNAMAPAVVDDVKFDDGKVVIFVAAHQMPSAVGNGGWNSHLAGELLGFPVEVRETVTA